MLSRRRPDTSAIQPTKRQRQRPEPEIKSVAPTRKRSGRAMNYSTLTEKVWARAENGIKTKDDLERAIRAANINSLPEEADESMAIAALLHNKGCSASEYISVRGKRNFQSMITLWQAKINIVLKEIRRRDAGE